MCEICPSCSIYIVVFDNGVLKTVLGLGLHKVGYWRELHREELLDLYSLRFIIFGQCSKNGEEEKYIQIFVGKSELYRPPSLSARSK
jgi:hypothetical protein